MLDTLRNTPPSGSTTLSSNFRADLHWWRDMLPTYNGRLLIQLTRPTYDLYIDVHDPTVSVHTCTHTTTSTIPTQVVALQLWGAQWQEAELLVHCADPKKLQVLVHGRSRNNMILQISRSIWRVTEQFDICLTPKLCSDNPSHLDKQVVPPPTIHLE